MRKLVIAVVVLALLAGSAYYVYANFFTSAKVPKLSAATPPPSLQVAGGAKGSFVETTQGTLQFDSNDKTEYEKNLSALKSKYKTASVAKSGVNYLFADSEITMGDIVKGVDPVANKLLLAYYDQGSFWTYPKGPFTGTKEIKKDDLATFKIAKNRVVIVITDKETTSYGLKSPTDKATDLLSVAPMGDSESGWVLVASKPTKLADLIAPFGSRVISAWALKGQNDFGTAPVDLGTFEFSTYSVVWLQLNKKPTESSGTTTTTTTTTAPTITSVLPSSLIQGTKAAKITITGENLANKSVELSPSASFGNVSAATASSDGKKIELTLDVKDDAAVGPVKIKVGSAENTSLSITQKGSTALKITGVSPTTLVQGDQQKEVTLTGENLINAKLESVQDLVIYSYEAPTATTFKFKVNVPETTSPGIKEINVSKGAEVVTIKTLEVKAKGTSGSADPAITSFSPSEAELGKTIDFEIKGTNLFDVVDISIGPTAVGTNTTMKVENTSIKGSIKIWNSIGDGPKDVSVKTSKGKIIIAATKFNVKPASTSLSVSTAPTITDYSPKTVKAGDNDVGISLTGTNLKFLSGENKSAVTFENGLSYPGYGPQSDDEKSGVIFLNVDKSASGSKKVTITNPKGEKAELTLTIQSAGSDPYGVKEGDTVLAQWESDQNKWSRAEVLKLNSDGTYSVKFKDDGVVKSNWPAAKIALLKNPTSLKQYQKAVAKNRKGEDTGDAMIFWSAHIVSVSGSNYEFGYDDEYKDGTYSATEKKGPEWFYVPLQELIEPKMTGKVASTTGGTSAGTAETPKDENDGWEIFFEE